MMTRFRYTVFGAAILAFIPLATASAASVAATPRLPASLYPLGAHLTYKPHVSNEEMDCMWNFVCEGYVPLFHTRPEGFINRTGGWAQFAGWQQGRRTMAFELFASRYAPGTDANGTPWAAFAYADLRTALKLHHYRPLAQEPKPLAFGAEGNWLAESVPDGDTTLVVMAAWTGRQDTEAIVMVNQVSAAARKAAVALLAAQVQRSLSSVPAGSGKNPGANVDPRVGQHGL